MRCLTTWCICCQPSRSTDASHGTARIGCSCYSLSGGPAGSLSQWRGLGLGRTRGRSMRCEDEVHARLRAGEDELRALADEINKLSLQVKIGDKGWREALE